MKRKKKTKMLRKLLMGKLLMARNQKKKRLQKKALSILDSELSTD